MELPFELLLYADSGHFRPRPATRCDVSKNLSHLRSDQKFIAQRARMSIVRELKFAERIMPSGRDLEDQKLPEFELKAPILKKVSGLKTS